MRGGWRERYRAVDEEKPALRGLGKNGQPFAFHLALPVDASGELPDGRPFRDIRDFKRLVSADEAALARNFARQLLLFATGAPAHYSDRPEVERILAETTRYRFTTPPLRPSSRPRAPVPWNSSGPASP